MVKEGYLVKYETGKEGTMANIVYVKFEDGVLRIFSHKNGRWTGEFRVSGKSSKVELLPDQGDRLPHRFCVTTHDIVARNDALYYGSANYIEFSASSAYQQLEWGNTVHLWKRNFWREKSVKMSGAEEPTVPLSDEQEEEMLRKAIEKRGLKSDSLKPETRLKRRSSYRPRAVTFALPPNPMGMSPITLQQPASILTTTSHTLMVA